MESASPQTLDTLCTLVAKHLDAKTLGLEQIVTLACSRPIPVARLALQWLQARSITSADDCRLVARLANAQADAMRPELIRWLRTTVGSSSFFQNEFLLDLLDSPKP